MVCCINIVFVELLKVDAIIFFNFMKLTLTSSPNFPRISWDDITDFIWPFETNTQQSPKGQNSSLMIFRLNLEKAVFKLTQNLTSYFPENGFQLFLVTLFLFSTLNVLSVLFNVLSLFTSSASRTFLLYILHIIQTQWFLHSFSLYFLMLSMQLLLCS